MYLLTWDSDLLDILWVCLHVVPPCFYSGPEGPKTFLITILSYSYDYITALDSKKLEILVMLMFFQFEILGRIYTISTLLLFAAHYCKN